MSSLRAAGLYTHGEEDRCAFPCALLCSGCGRLRWEDDPTAGDPHRRTTRERNPACSHCRARAWIDLQNESTFSTLIDTELYDADARRRFLQHAGMSAGVFGLVAPAVAVLGGAIAATLFAGVGLLGVGIAGKRGGVLLRRRSLPRRWSMVLPPRVRVRTIATGGIASEARLIAPLSGRECVAYELGARDDDRAQANLRSWLLLEQRNVALTVAGHHIGANAVHLDVPRTPHPRREDDLDPGHTLRARGVDPGDPELVLFETILEAGAAVTLGTDGGTTVLTPTGS